MKTGCAGALEEANLIDVLVELLCSAQEVMAFNPGLGAAKKEEPSAGATAALPKDKDKSKDGEDVSSHTPKWLAPAMLLLDLYEQLSVATKRRAAVKKVPSVFLSLSEAIFGKDFGVNVR